MVVIIIAFDIVMQWETLKKSDASKVNAIYCH